MTFENFSPEERQCYFEDEIQLLHLPHDDSFRHDISNCLFEATLQQIQTDCNCVPAYFQHVIPDVKVCSGSKIKCMNDLKKSMGEFRYIMDRGNLSIHRLLKNFVF